MMLSFEPMTGDDLDWVSCHERQLHAFPWSQGNFDDSMAAGYSCWVMREGECNLGYAVVMLVLDEAHLLNISIIRARQGQGLGWTLLGHLCAVVREAGARQMFLEVRPSNAKALALYRRAGFQQVGRRRGYYPGENGREDALIMRLPL
jgi:ribosomal-protein-alanine N-acetyltransferase